MRSYPRLLIAFLTVLLTSLPTISHARSVKDSDEFPAHDRRSCIQAVDGYAYLSENMTLAETRAAAFNNAKRQAIEGAMTYIQSKTRVENLRIEYDLIMSSAEGAVTVLEQRDYGVEKNTRYHVWIKAEVVYDLKPKKTNAEQNRIMVKDAPLTVKVWTDKKEYMKGEEVKIFVKGNRDFFARIVHIAPNGKIIQLVPNLYRPTNLFLGGKVYVIPDRGDQFDLDVTPPYGEENIVVYASDAQLGDVSMESIGQGLKLYRGMEENLASQSRSVKIVESGSELENVAEFYEASWMFRTIK